MNYINLTKEYFIDRGRERACYIHPSDESKVIKISYKEKEELKQNQLEFLYQNFLEKKGKSLAHLSKCFGPVKTNLGHGYIFERVRDYTGETSKSFKYMIIKKKFDLTYEKKLLEELSTYLLENNIIFVDVAFSNIFCQEVSKNEFKLIITDGVGGKRLGFKSKLYLLSKVYTRYKVKKQIQKLYKRYKNVINESLENKNKEY